MGLTAADLRALRALAARRQLAESAWDKKNLCWLVNEVTIGATYADLADQLWPKSPSRYASAVLVLRRLRAAGLVASLSGPRAYLTAAGDERLTGDKHPS